MVGTRTPITIDPREEEKVRIADEIDACWREEFFPDWRNDLDAYLAWREPIVEQTEACYKALQAEIAAQIEDCYRQASDKNDGTPDQTDGNDDGHWTSFGAYVLSEDAVRKMAIARKYFSKHQDKPTWVKVLTGVIQLSATADEQTPLKLTNEEHDLLMFAGIVPVDADMRKLNDAETQQLQLIKRGKFQTPAGQVISLSSVKPYGLTAYGKLAAAA